jgi:hypothetical protein
MPVRPKSDDAAGSGGPGRLRDAGSDSSRRMLELMSTDASEMVTIRRADLEAMQAELRRLRREAGREAALAAMRADRGPGSGDTARVFTREQLAEAWGIRA